MSRINRALTTVLTAALLSTSLAACAPQSASEATTTSTTANVTDGKITITDIEGRNVTLDKAPQRVILAEGRGLFVTSVLDKENPLDRVVAMGSDLKSAVPDFYGKLEQKFPAVKKVTDIGRMQKGDVLAETITALHPDIMVITDDQYKYAQKGGLLQQLDAAKVPYVVTDFRNKPLENTTKSVEIYGKVFGKEDRAKAFNATWKKNVEMVKERAAKAGAKPDVMVWRAAGLLDCCATWNDASIAQLVNFAGGANAGDKLLKGETGSLTPEKVVEINPDIIITTGGDWSKKKNKAGQPIKYAAAGYGVDPATGRQTLNDLVTNQSGFELLKAPKEGNLHNIWHQFYDSPLNYVALVQMAKWIHPEQYQDVDVNQLWKDAHNQFMPFAPEGTFFVTNK